MNCADCAKVVVEQTGDVENYLVHDDVWASAGLQPTDGFLCVECLEARLGRKLTGADLRLDVPINSPNVMRDTPRLHQLKADAHASGS